MSFKVIKTRSFERSLSKLDKSVRDRILKDIKGFRLEEDPTSGKPLHDEIEVIINDKSLRYRLWEIKVGPKRNYRVFYIFDSRRKEIYLLDIEHRKRAFRRS